MQKSLTMIQTTQQLIQMLNKIHNIYKEKEANDASFFVNKTYFISNLIGGYKKKDLKIRSFISFL